MVMTMVTESAQASMSPLLMPKTLAEISGRLRILVVDDELMPRQMLKRMLELDGHLPELADNGLEGVQTFTRSLQANEPFDLVITDLAMPTMHGGEVARLVKQASPHTPVILLTGWMIRPSDENSASDVVDVYADKPVRLVELRGAVAEAIAMYPRQR